MGKSTPSAPAAPDPAKTAQAQTASNKETALYNFGLNNPNVNTPLGSQSYSVSNTTPVYDYNAYNKALDAYKASPTQAGPAPLSYSAWLAQNPNSPSKGYYSEYLPGAQKAATGTPSKAPTLDQFITSQGGNPSVTQNITLSPEQQQLYDLSTSQSIDLSKLASMLQGSVGNSLQQPTPGDADFNAQSQKAQDAYYQNQTRMLDPQWTQNQEQLDAKLANQGITMGSEAYNNEQGNFARQKQSAYDTAQNNAILQGPQNAQQLFSLSSAARELPLNEFNALRSQSQVSMPQFGGVNTANAAGTDVAGINNQAYQAQLGAYNAQLGASNSATSGLFGLAGKLGGAYASSPAGSAALTALFSSDIRLKENIIHTGYERGLPVYLFNYKDDPKKRPYRGVMAQDVLFVMPQAVLTDGVYMSVDYGMLGIEFGRVH